MFTKQLTTLSIILLLQACMQAEQPAHSLEVAVKGMHSGALSEHGELAVIGSINHGGSLWRIQSEERLFNWNHRKGEFSTIVAADFSSDGRWALTADPAALVLWNTQSGEGTRYWNAPGEILDAELGPGANTALLGLSDHSAVLFDIQKGGIKQTLRHGNRVRSVDMTEDGRLALTGSEDYTATSWDLNSGKMIASLKHEDEVQLVKLAKDASIALSVSKYDKALLWEPRSGNIIGEVPLKAEHLKRGLSFTSAAFNKDNSYLLTGRPDQVVQLWKIPELYEVQRWRLPKRDKWKPTSASVIALSHSSDPNIFFALASNGFVHQLQTKTPGELPGVIQE
ncbi:hypothetical protein SAMN02745866_00767 [Alteromonadaceae bacterium Bs31]|nr:hypothetical protein SAMN02745866_00767 [Alteromonadaceae bacterium Bs31]